MTNLKMNYTYHKDRYIKMLSEDISYYYCNGCNEKWKYKSETENCLICKNSYNLIDNFKNMGSYLQFTLAYKESYHKGRYINMLPNNVEYNSCSMCGELWYKSDLKECVKFTGSDMYKFYRCTGCDK